MNNEGLVLAAKCGDDEAFYALIILHKDKMYRIAYTYMKNETEALEAVQEATCRAYVQLRKLREPSYFGSWLIRILMNYCVDELKRRAICERAGCRSNLLFLVLPSKAFRYHEI